MTGSVSLPGEGVSLIPGSGSGVVVAGSGIVVTSGSTVSLGTIAAGDILGNSGTVAATPSATAIGAGLTLASGTLSATGATAANTGAVLNSGTVQVNNATTLAGTAAGTVTIAPATGTSDVILNMPASGGTVTATGNASFSRQRMLLEIHQGATAGVLNLGTVFHFTGAITSFTLTSTAAAIDRLEFISTDGTNWVNLAINQNATL